MDLLVSLAPKERGVRVAKQGDRDPLGFLDPLDSREKLALQGKERKGLRVMLDHQGHRDHQALEDNQALQECKGYLAQEDQ